jgi:ABC-2 type transport system permease protein
VLYIGTHRALSFIRGVEFMGEANAERFVSMVFFSLMGFLFLSNLITAISSFYLSKDLPFLRTTPLGVGDILDAKAVETVLDSSWMVLGFIPPVLAAMGTVYGAPYWYYPAVFVLFVLFILVSSGAGITAAHLLTWLFPAKRLRDALLLAGLVLFVLIYFLLRSQAPGYAENPLEMFEALVAVRVDSTLLPCYWITEAAMPMLRGRAADVLYPALLLSNCMFFLLLSRSVGLRLHARNLERLRSGGGRGGGARRPLYPGGRYALLWKDARLFFRDTGQWSQLLIILALAFVYVYNFSALPLDVMSGYFPLVKEAMVLINVLMAGLVLSAVSARFVYASVSLEGRAFWVVRTSPVSTGRFLFGKYVYGLVPVAVFTGGMAALSNLMVEANGALTALSSATVVLLSMSVCGLGTGMGALWPKFKYDNIASVSMSLGGMAFMVAAMCVVGLTIALVAWPYYLYLKAGGPDWTATALCAALVLAVNLSAFYFPMRAGAKALSNPDL